MKHVGKFIISSFVGGLLVVMPLYLTVLLLLKVMRSVAVLVRPLASLMPEWLPAEEALSLLLVVTICFLIGVPVRAPAGQAARDGIDKFLSERLPGYALFRGLTQQVAGKCEDHVWEPALAEIEEALVPAFIIEELEDGRFTVFVPSAPTPFSGAVYILPAERVHPVNVPFAQAIRTLSRWGSGSKALVAAMKTESGLKWNGRESA